MPSIQQLTRILVTAQFEKEISSSDIQVFRGVKSTERPDFGPILQRFQVPKMEESSSIFI